MIWLGIETSSTPLSIALMKGDEVLVEHNATVAVTHSVRAMSVIEDVCRIASIEPSHIEAIAVSEGPGSYTGVRIGVTIAKTLAWTLDLPLIGVSSLQVMARNLYEWDGLVVSALDARRAHVYSGVYRIRAGNIEEVLLVDEHRPFTELLNFLRQYEERIAVVSLQHHIYEEQWRQAFAERVHFVKGAQAIPRASHVIELAVSTIGEEDIHSFTPQYLRMTEAEANLKKEQKVK